MICNASYGILFACIVCVSNNVPAGEWRLYIRESISKHQVRVLLLGKPKTVPYIKLAGVYFGQYSYIVKLRQQFSGIKHTIVVHFFFILQYMARYFITFLVLREDFELLLCRLGVNLVLFFLCSLGKILLAIGFFPIFVALSNLYAATSKLVVRNKSP